MRSFLTLSLVILAFCALTGCSTLQAVKRQPFVATTNAVPTVIEIPATTNIVVSPDGAGTIEVVTPAKTITNWSTNIVVEVNPTITSGIDGARTINRLANPTPAAPLVDLGLYALSGILGIVATWKTRKLQRAQDQLSQTNELLDTVIAGVETAKDQKTKDAIKEFSQLWGTRTALHNKVQQVTRSEV